MAKSKQAVIQVDTGNAQKSLADLRKLITETKSALYQLTEGSQEYNDKLQELGYAQDELNSFMAKTRQGCSALEGSYNALSYQMGILKQLYHETNEEAKRSELATLINAINDKLKEMDEAVGNHSRNVGNYTKSMTEAFQKVGITIGNINPLFQSLADGMMAAGEKGGTAFANLGTAAKGLGTLLKALVANPVGAVIMAIVIAVKAAKAIFDKFKESVARNETAQNNLNKAMAPFKAIIEGITNAFDDFVEKLTAGAAAVGEFISKIMIMIGLSDERVKAENKIADMEKENAEKKRQYIVENSELELEASEARAEAAKKDQYTAEERIKFLETYKEKQDKIAKNNLDMAERDLALLQKQADQGKNNAEMNNKIAEAQARVNQAQQAYNDKLRETEGQISELRLSIKAQQEAALKAAQESAKKWAEEMKKMKEEYKTMMAAFADTLNEGNIDYQITKLTEKKAEEIKKLNELYKKHAISKQEYDKGMYAAENNYYLESQKLIKQKEDLLEQARINYNNIVKDQTENAINSIIRERDAAIEALSDVNLGLSDEEYMQAQEKLTEAYAKKIQKTKDEMYVKDANERMSIEMAADDLIYQNREAQLANDFSNRKMSLKDYINETLNMQIEANQNQIALEEAKQIEFQTLYEEGKISIDAYTEAMITSQTMVLDLQTLINAQIAELNNLLVDSYITGLSGVMDVMSEYMSEISSIGEGISSQWANVFSQMSASITDLGEALKDGGKDWGKWGKVAASAIGVVGSMMTAMADEQDTTTREGFETAKKYNIAAAVMSMLSGIAGAWASSMELMFPANIIVGSLLSTLITAVGGVQIAKIKQQQFDGGSSSASASSSTPSVNTSAISSVQAPVQWSSNVEGASTEQNVADTRVYVLQSDIYDTNKAVQVEESENRY